MAKTQNLKPDTILKNYQSNNEPFADLFNAVLFGGKQVFKPDELEDVDTEKSSSYGVEPVMPGTESQGHIHYGMPLRVMGYDYGTYTDGH